MTYLSPGLLDGSDRLDALLDEERDAELLDAERADLYVDHGEPVYLPTLAALQHLAERDECACAPARGIVHALLIVGVGYLLAAIAIAVVVL